MTTPADVMRCAECGIADENVLPPVPGGIDKHPPFHPDKDTCLAAALALLEQARPFIAYALPEESGPWPSPQAMEEQARALLAKFPEAT